MLLIKLDATDSTNAYLKELLVSQNPPDGTVVQAVWQKKGRGQLGRDWVSEPGKNLTISILKRFEGLEVSEQFVLSIITSLAVAELLKKYQVPNIQVKWPNDILSGEQKLCGILVENMVKGNQLNSAIIGIGLNVNQDQFPPELKASSIKMLTTEVLILEEVLKDLMGILDQQFEKYLHKSLESAIEAYEELLFRRGEEVKFRTTTEELLTGTILGIDTLGRLIVSDSQNTTAYGFNEIRMVI